MALNNYDDFNYIATYHFDGFDLKYNGGFQGYNYYLNYNAADTSVESFTLATLSPATTPLTINPLLNLNYNEDDWWTAHDFTFQSTTDGPLQWTAGAFYFHQRYNNPIELSDPNQPQLQHPLASVGALTTLLTTGVANLGAANPNGDIFYNDYAFNVDSVAGYGEASYKINDQWRITGNLRYTSDDKEGTEASRYIAFPVSAQIPIGVGPGGVPITQPLAAILGVNTPALDDTLGVGCHSGNSKVNPTQPSGNDCNTAAFGLGKGVKTMGVITPGGYAFRELGTTSTALTGGAGIEWTPTEDIFTYFRYGRGYEAPSFNAGGFNANPEVGPETLNSYEIGYKQSFGKSLLVDLAAFYYDYDNLQLPITVINGGVTQTNFINVPKSESTGIEAEVYWNPVKDLSVTFSYSFDYTAMLTKCSGTVNAAGVLTPAGGALCLVDTNDRPAVQPGHNAPAGQIYSATTNPGLLQGVNGNPLPNAPENKVAINVAYTWHFEPGTLTASIAGAWRDTQEGSVFERSYNQAPSWYDIDLRALWKGPNDKYEIIAFVKNLTNTLQYDVGDQGTGLSGNASGTTSATAGFFENNIYDLAPPRTYGLEVRYKFF